MFLKQTLENIGLEPKEVALYLACLELGEARASDVAQMSKVSRTSCYDVLEALKKKGLLTRFEKRKIQYYRAEDPVILKEKAASLSRAMQSAFPELKSLYKKGSIKNKPKVKFYEGRSGIREMFQNILKEKNLKHYDIIASQEDWLNVDRKFFNDFRKKRAEKKIFTRLIFRESPEAREHMRKQKEYFGETKILTQGEVPEYSSGILIFSDKVIFTAPRKEYVSVLIESREIAEIMKFIFEFMWRSL